MDTTVVSAAEDASRTPVRRRVAVVFTDIVGSTRLLSALGDLAGNRRVLEHHELAARILQSIPGGEIINTAGDSIFLAFPGPRQALLFALRLQRELQSWRRNDPAHLRVRDRVGIHFGEVEESRRPDGARDLTGFTVSLAASITDLAGADQILLSAAAFDIARAAPPGDAELAEFGQLRWVSHGRYSIKGVENAFPIFEVGEEGVALLSPPNRSKPARVAPDDDLIGWRPALGNCVPGSSWRLDRFLGSSGFGEVWLAHDTQTEEARALRFCFRPGRVRALLAAAPLFEQLRSRVGAHPHVARLHSFRFDHAPHFLENEYVAGASLPELFRERAPTQGLTEEARLEIVAQVAEALDAAHRAGVVHGDLKPEAVVVRLDEAGDRAVPRVKVIDFGTGLLLAHELADELVHSRRTPVHGALPPPDPAAGAPLYWAPELFKGHAPSQASDIYALGVLLYQVVVGDLSQPVTIDIARRIRDPLLLEDLLACLATDPAARLASASELAHRLRRLPERRRELARRERRSYWQGVLRTAFIGAVLVGLMGTLAWRAMEQHKEAARRSVELRVANGVRLMQEGDLVGSLEQFIDAIEQDTSDVHRQNIHRRRIASVLRSAPRQVREWRLPGRAGAVDVDPLGQWIVAGTQDGVIRVFDIASGRPLGPDRDAGGPLNVIGFTESRTGLFAHRAQGPLLFWPWPPAAGEPPPHPQPLWSNAADVAYSRARGRFAVATFDAGVILVPDRPGARPEPLPGLDSFRHVAFSPDGELLVGATAVNDEGRINLALWNVRERALLHSGTLTQDRETASSARFLAIDPAKECVLVGAARQVHLLSAADFSPLAPPRVHEDTVTVATFAPRGSFFMSTSAGRGSRVKISDLNGASGVPWDLPHPHSVTSGDFSPDGRYVLTGCFDRHLRLWDPDRVQLVAEPLRHPGWHDHSNFRVRLLPDGRRALTMVDDMVRVFDFASHASTLPCLTLEAGIRVVAVSGDGRRIAAAAPPGDAAVWDAETAARLTPRIRYGAPIRALAFNKDATRLVALEHVGAGKPARVWVTDLSAPSPATRVLDGPPKPVSAFFTGARLHVLGAAGDWHTWNLRLPQSQPVVSRVDAAIEYAVLAPDMETIAIVGPGGSGASEIRLLDVNRRAKISGPIVPGQRVRRVAFSPDSRRLASASTDAEMQPRAALIWDVATGQRLYSPLSHEDGVLDVAWRPDIEGWATVGEDSLLRLWRGDRLPNHVAEQRMGYQALDVTFSPDGKLVAATSADGAAQVWESESGEPVTPRLRHQDVVWQAWFVAGGRRLLTFCNDGRLYLWDVDPIHLPLPTLRALAEEMKGVAPRELNPDGWTPPLPVSTLAVAAWHQRETDRCVALGQPRLALFHLDRAVEAMSQAPDARTHLALLHWRRAALLKELANAAPSTERATCLEEAARSHREALQLDPDLKDETLKPLTAANSP